MWANAFLLAVRQILRNPMRSLLTVLGIVIGVAAVITMVTVGNGTTQAVRSQIESLGSNQLMIRPGQRMGPGGRAGAPAFKMADVEALGSQIAGVSAAAPQQSKAVTVIAEGRNWTTQITGTTNAYFEINNWGLSSGRYFEESELRAGSAVCLVGSTITKELFAGSDPVGQMIRTGKFSSRIIGVLQTKGQSAMGGDQDDIVIVPFVTYQRRISGSTNVASILLSVDKSMDRASVISGIESLMRERRSLSDTDVNNFTILDTEEIARMVSSTTEMMTLLLGAVAAVSLIVGGIGIMNIMLVSVTERTREIGVRLAIGALKKEVLMQFLIESVVLGALGGVLGVVIAFIGSFALTVVMNVPYIFNFSINVLAFMFSAVTGIVFGYFPARRAANLDPIEAVRHE
ncbi:MAG TPA: multidrug ABC transporter substrate-binding protein [Sutterella sp.]|nr:multidrug ABC transporter substrate-binding protein [Sutterella sp.]